MNDFSLIFLYFINFLHIFSRSNFYAFTSGKFPSEMRSETIESESSTLKFIS